MNGGWQTLLLSIAGTLLLAMTAQYFLFLQDMARQSEVEKVVGNLMLHIDTNRNELHKLEVTQSQWNVLQSRMTTLEGQVQQLRNYLIDHPSRGP